MWVDSVTVRTVLSDGLTLPGERTRTMDPSCPTVDEGRERLKGKEEGGGRERKTILN